MPLTESRLQPIMGKCFLKIIPFIPGTPRTNPVHFPTRIIESPSPVLINIALSFSLGFNDKFPDILRKKL